LPVKSPKTTCVKARHNRLFTSQKKAGLNKGRGIHCLRHHADSRIIPTNRDESGALLTPLQFKSA
jgi:hypothetical protein